MNPGTQFGFEHWLPRRDYLLLTLGVWVAGFAVAGAAAWRLNHEPATLQAHEMYFSGAASPEARIAESEGVVVMPQDVVVGREAPSTTGVTLKQKP